MVLVLLISILSLISMWIIARKTRSFELPPNYPNYLTNITHYLTNHSLTATTTHQTQKFAT